MAGLSFNDPITGRNTFGHESGETVATYNDIDDFDGLTFNPPIDAMRKPIADLSQYSQVVSVVPVYSTQLSGNSGQTLDIPKTTYTGAARVTVRILYQRTPKLPAEEVYRLSWIRVDD